jgi:hypothetical protein
VDLDGAYFFVDVLIDSFYSFSDAINFLVDLCFCSSLLFLLHPLLDVFQFAAQFILVFLVLFDPLLYFCQFRLNILHKGSLLDFFLEIIGGDFFGVDQVVE